MQTRFITALLSIFVFGSTLLKAQPSSAQTITGTVSFVDRLGDGVLSYQSGDSLYVRVEDADRDVSATTADTLSVYLTSSIEQVYQTKQDQKVQAPIAIVPNPSKGIFEIQNFPEDATYELQNLLGQRMIHNGRNSSVDISDLPSGTYLLIVHSNGEQIVERIIKTE